MNHLTDATLLALADGELSADEQARARSHANVCSECSVRLATIEAQRRMLDEALAHLDVEPPMASARDAILRRGRRGAGVAARSRRAWWRSSFAKAAGLILAFAAAGSAALPGSPLRVWLGELVDREESPEGAAADLVEPPVQPDEAAPPPEVGVHLVESAGRVRISVVGLSPGGEVLVELVDGQSSGVFAAEGARFQTGPGQVEAEVPGSWVRIELARSLGSADVEVDGALYLRKTGERLQLLGPDRDSTDAQIRFRLPSEGS